MTRIILLFTLIVIGAAPAMAAPGESSVIALIFPFGARATGMGELGTALADDEATLYYNPAGLGCRQEDWRRGSVANSFEVLLPAFKYSELWHENIAGYYQAPGNIGGFGMYMNYLNMGQRSFTGELGRGKSWNRMYERVWSFGYGTSFREFGDSTRYAGFAIKPFASALAHAGLGENGAGVARSIAFDLGYLRVLKNGLRFGLNIANMGPTVGPTVYYVSQVARDPIPQTLNCAVGWKKKFISQARYEYLRVAAELRLDKELVINHYDSKPDPFYKAFFVDLTNEPVDYELREINYHVGAEVWIFNVGCLRQGFLIDYYGERYEHTIGFGVRLFNHFRMEYSWIYAPEGYMPFFLRPFNRGNDGATGARNGQWQLTIAVDALGGGSREDLKWWKVSKQRERW